MEKKQKNINLTEEFNEKQIEENISSDETKVIETLKNDDTNVEEKDLDNKDVNEINEEKTVEILENENTKEKNTLKNDDLNFTKKSRKSFIIVSSIILSFILLLLVFSTVFAIIANSSNTIINGIKIRDIDVSGLTREEALKKVSSEFNNRLSKSFTLKYNEYELEIFPKQFDISFDVEGAVNTAFSRGRSSNIFVNNYEVLSSILFGFNINPAFSYNKETLDSLSQEMESHFPDRLIESSYYIENNNLIICKGTNGITINKENLILEMIYYITNKIINTTIINIPVISKNATVLNLEKIYNEVYRAPKDAYYTTNPYVIYPHVDGVDFAISLEEANNLLNQNTNQCSIPLKVLSPSVTINNLSAEAFPNLLASYSTTFNAGNVNRTTNIKLSTAKIDGTVVMPGEVFSYNQIVGQRTAAAGYKPAAVYVGGEVATGIGGGICQVSSTLYNTALLSNLEIVERYNHAFDTGYVPVGRDATVSWGSLDFKFKNSRNYPIKILASIVGNKLTVDIYGLKSDNEYDVEIQSYVTSYIGYKTIEKPDPTLTKGETKVIEKGSSGCRSVAYRILKQNGNIISKTLLSKDTYHPHNRVVAVGTKEVPAPVTPDIEPNTNTTI